MKEVLIALHQKPIAYYPIYRDITGSTTAAILLSQLLYWYSACKGKKFYKTDSEIMEETRLTEKELRNAKSCLKKFDFIIIELEGLPRRTFYSFNETNLHRLLVQSSDAQRASLETPKGRVNNRPKGIAITENTKNFAKSNSEREEPTLEELYEEEIKQVIDDDIKRELALEKPKIQETINQPILTKTSDGHQLNDLILTVERYYQANPDAKRMAIETARFSEGVHGSFAEELRKFVTEYSSNAVFASNPTKDLHRMMTKWLMNAKNFNRNYSAKNQLQNPVQPYKVPQTRYLIEE